jgi:protein SCO1/2
MSLTKFVSIAGTALIVALGGTFLITQIMVPAKRFEDCVGGGVAGGAAAGGAPGHWQEGSADE